MIRIASLIVVAAVAVAVVLVNPLQGQQTKAIKIGDACPAFKDLPGVDGKKHSLSDYKKDVVVVVITCNHCPVANAYEQRIKDFTKKFQGKVDVVAICVNRGDGDKMPQMIERAKDQGYNFPYLADESQQIGQALGAAVTPHFFVLNKDRKLVYRGAMDDKNEAAAVTKHYLESAVNSVLSGESPASAETDARGCGISYK